MPVWPVAAISRTTSLTRSRNAVRSRVSASSRIDGVLGQVGAHQVADLGVVAVEQRGQRGHVDRRLDVALRLRDGRSVRLLR